MQPWLKTLFCSQILALTHIAGKKPKNDIFLLITPVFINNSKQLKMYNTHYQ